MPRESRPAGGRATSQICFADPAGAPFARLRLRSRLTLVIRNAVPSEQAPAAPDHPRQRRRERARPATAASHIPSSS